MFPTHGLPEYAAIERRAEELRQQTLRELASSLKRALARQVSAVQDLAARVCARMYRNASASSFEAQ